LTTLVRPPERATSGLLLAILCSELLLALSFVRLWGDANSAIFRTSVIDAALDQPIWGTALAWNIAGFVAALLLTHLLLGITAWCLAKLSRHAWPQSKNSLRVWSLFWLVFLTIWILAANAAWFPSSSLGSPYAGALEARLFGASVLQLITIAILGPLAWTFWGGARQAWPYVRKRPKWTMGAVVIGGSATAFASFGVSAPDANATRERPHVILIGLDALRPDALHDEDGRDVMPAINAFLAQSTVFSDTLTPLARTFPAWVSIVSGKHPHTTGAIMNLLPRELIDEGDTLPKLLAGVGYHTVYATDEVRFSNLDETYGFRELIAPPMGASDFLLSFFADTPLANLLVNTAAGAVLFPHTHANRAAAVTYDPDTFIERVARRLRFDKPTLLAVHLTLTHWPHTWASTPALETGEREATLTDKYRRAAIRADQQFGDLLEMLRDRGALQNAIVVVLSDHGEALGEPASLANEGHAARHIPALSASYGHGTNVFSEGQYRVLLAMQSFGNNGLATPAGLELAVPASLEDIAPTIADALQLEPKQPFDGISWLGELKGAPSSDDELRIRYLETEFVPPGLESGSDVSRSMLRQAAPFYRVDAKTDRVLIRDGRLSDIMQSRQYAATRQGAFLASVPSDDKLQQHVVFLEHPGAEPVWLTTAPTAARDPGHELWNALQARFERVRERPIARPLGNDD
jgi:arylsulfatase A-like enzyme